MDQERPAVSQPRNNLNQTKRKQCTASALIKRAKGTGSAADKDKQKRGASGLRVIGAEAKVSATLTTTSVDSNQEDTAAQQQNLLNPVVLSGLLGSLPVEVLDIVLAQCTPQQLGMLETSSRYFMCSGVTDRIAREQLKNIPRAKLLAPKFWALLWLVAGITLQPCWFLITNPCWDVKPTTPSILLAEDRPEHEEEIMPAVVSCGGSHSASISRRGELFTWGLASSGELGHGDSSIEVNQPIQCYLPPPRPRIVSVAAGGHHTLAISEDGGLWSCGRGKHGQLGQGLFEDSSTLQPVEGLRGHRIVSVAGGFQHSAALAADGTMFTWGCGKYGQLGLMHLSDLPILIANNLSLPTPCKINKLDPSRLPPANKVTALAAGAYHTVALTVGGEMLVFGRNKHGALGTGDTTHRFIPTRVIMTRETARQGGARVAQVACGEAHTLALVVRNGLTSVYAAGYNYWGQLGLNDTRNRLKFTMIPFIKGSTSVQSGDNHSMAIAREGTMYVWGRGDCGQLGLGEERSQRKPMAVPGFKVVHPDRTLRRSTRAVPRIRPAAPPVKKAKRT